MSSGGQIRAGQGYVELSVKDGLLRTGLDRAAGMFRSFGTTIATIGASIAAAGAAVTAPFLSSIGGFSEWGAEMSRTMRETGIGFYQLDELMDGTGASADELVPALARLSAAMHEAVADPASEAAARFGTLGLSVRELEGMSLDQRFLAVANAVSQIGDEGERLNAMRVFFRNTSLNVSGGAAGIAARAARRDEVEGQLTESDLQLSKEYNKALKEMKAAITGVWMQFGAAAAPAMRDFYSAIVEGVIIIRRFIEANRSVLEVIFGVAAVLISAGTVIGALGASIYAVSYAFAFLSGLVPIVSGAFAAALYPASLLVTIGFVSLKIALWAYKIAALAATVATTILTSGINILAVVVGVLASVALVALVAALAAPVAMFGLLAYRIAEATGALGRIGYSAQSAASTISASFMNAFYSIIESGQTAMSVLQSAFRRGDWATVWEVVKVMAQIAWNEISTFAIETFYALKSSVITIWESITDSFYDAWADTWMAMAVLFERGTTAIKYVFLTLAADIIDSFGPVMDTIRTVLEGMALVDPTGNAAAALAALGGVSSEELRRTAREINSGAGEAAIRERARLDAVARLRERDQRNADRAMLEDQERRARAAGNQAEAARLNGELVQMQNVERALGLAQSMLGVLGFFNDEAQRGGPQGVGRPQFAGLSGFNAQLLFGALNGGARRQTDAQRAEAQRQEQLRRLDEQIRALRDIARVAGARWG